MDRCVYLNIVQDILLPFAEEYMLGKWLYQADNDPKHSPKVVKTSLNDNNIRIMKWLAQSPDLNPIEMLWIDVDKHQKRIKGQKPKNIEQLYSCVQKAWNSIPASR